jgi:hypothetical protein
MASLIYNSFWGDLAKGSIDMDTDSFKAMLVTSAYTPDKDTHLKRSSVTNELAATGGYTAGGVAVTCTVTVNTGPDQTDISLGAASWASSTLTARGAVYYKARGGASSADELVAYIDFGSDIISSAGTFALTASTLRIQN